MLAGCAVKIAPGHVKTETVQKATPEMTKEPEPIVHEEVTEAVSAPELQADEDENVSETVPPEGEAAVEEEEKEEVQKPRFARSKMIQSVPYRVTMKTKKFAFSDTGFLNRYDNLINLQIFTMGKLTLDMVVRLNDDEICVGSLCNTKHGFNQTFLNGAYPDTLVENVLQSKPILKGKNLKRTANGFLQKIRSKEYIIKYKIWPGNIYFKDVKNGIIIRLRKLSK